MQSHRFPRHFLLALFLLFAFGLSSAPFSWIANVGQAPKSKAAYSSPTRAKTVEFFIGQFSGDGTTGKNTNTNNTLPVGGSSSVRLAETNVVVKNAYVEYEFQFGAYTAQTITSSTLSFDACVASCTANAWAASGNVSTTDPSTPGTDSSESSFGRMYLNVTNEPQIANYKGAASGTLAVQAGYRFRFSSAANNIANASAKLVITYTYDESSPEVTNTVLYPLESQQAGDSGTQTALATSSCTIGSDCPSFSYNMALGDLSATSSRLSQWFYVGGVARANSTVDQTFFAQVGSNAGATTTLEESLSDNDGGYYWYFASSTGFLENATQTLNVKSAGTTVAAALVGGEVFDTYRASSSAVVRTKTVRYGFGAINSGADTNKGTATVNVFLPETGVVVKKAWVRLTTSYDGVAISQNLFVTTKVGSGSESASTTYIASCGGQCIGNDIKIFHVLPSSTYATIATATAVTSTPVTVSTQWATAKGATSGEFLITYTYTGETGGYQTTHSIFATQQTSTPATSWTGAGVDPVLPDTGGGLSIRSAFLEANMLYSDPGGNVTTDPTFGASMASTTCTVGNNSSTKLSDTESARFLLHADVSSTLTTSDSATYKVCYANSGSVGKFGGTLVYTYVNAFPTLTQDSYHWRNDDDLWDHIVTSTIDSAGSVGSFASLALTSSGVPVVAYMDDTNTRLKIALCGNTECSSGNVTSSPDPNTAPFGSTIGLLVRSDGKPLVSYYRNSDSNLIFINCGNTTCSSGNTTSSLITGGGQYSSMRFNSSSNPVILSYAPGSAAVYLYRCGNTTCSSGNASSALFTETSGYHSLALSSDGLANMSFFSIFGLRFGHCTVVNCSSVTPTTLHGTGANQYTSLALDGSDVPSVAYLDSSNNIRLYRCDNTTCSSGTSSIIESGGSFSGYASLVLGSSSLPYVSYALSGKLKLAHCGNAGCTSTSSDSMPIDSDVSLTGFYSSLELDSSYNPIIAYQDGINTDLKVAKVYMASSATGGSQNTAFSTAQNGTAYKLRIGLDNTGGGTTSSTFRLEYGLKTGGSCSSIGAWTVVGPPGGSTDIVMASSSNMTNGSTTLDIPRPDGGVSSSAGDTFTAGETKNTTSTTSAITLSGQTITELEFAIKGTVNSTSSNPYCFRLTKAGTALDSYTNYPELQFHSTPTISGISVNGGSPIVLTANSTTSVSVNFTISDADGCSDVFSNGHVTTTLFRTSKTATCDPNDFHCYRISSVTTNSCSPPGTSANATTTFYIQYFADATDASSSFTTDSWRATIDFTDSASLGGSSSSATTSLLTLVGVNISTSSMSYGTVSASSNTGSTNQSVTVKNSGNSSTTLKINGTALTMGANTLATSSQHYATSSFTFGGNEQSLSDTATTISGVTILRPTIGTWATSTNLPNNLSNHVVLTKNNFLYVLGGTDSLSNAVTTTVRYASLSTSTGSVGSWATTTPLPYGVGQTSGVVYNSYAYILGGGAVGGNTSTVIYAPINTSGTLGSWATTTPLPYAPFRQAASAYNGYMYVSGGTDGGVDQTSSIFYAPINTSGTLGSWATTTPLPYTYELHNFVISSSTAYLIGGAGDSFGSTSTVWRSTVSSTGKLGSWSQVSSLPYSLYAGTAFSSGDVLYLFGGYSALGLHSSTLSVAINPDRSLGVWSSSSPIASTYLSKNPGVFNSDNNFVYLAGGDGGQLTGTSSVFYARLPAQNLYFGVSVSSGVKVGTYTGTNTFTAFFTP